MHITLLDIYILTSQVRSPWIIATSGECFRVFDLISVLNARHFGHKHSFLPVVYMLYILVKKYNLSVVNVVY